MKYDYIIVGGGIAGIATAEIFSRSGFSVCILERNKKLCNESSGNHHEWFHFGSLYSILPKRDYVRILVGGIDDLLLYYRDFKNMNLCVNNKGSLIFKNDSKKSWFKDERLNYLFNLKKSSNTWNSQVKNFIKIHYNFFKYDWRKGEASRYIPITSIKKKINQKNLTKKFFLNKKTYNRVSSFDCPMESKLIINDLLQSYISYGGKIKLNFNVKKIRETNELISIFDQKNNKIECKKIIFANGSGINNFLKKEMVSSYLSPLIIVYPNILNKNIIIMTKNKSDAINHIFHEHKGRKYSLIGGGDFIEAKNTKNNIEKLSKNLIRLANKSFKKINPKRLHVYFGVKNEVNKNQNNKRNYLYTIKKIKRNIYYINPGKFSLAFSLAINTFKKIIGHYPNPTVNINKKIIPDKYIQGNYHKNFILKMPL